jgi:hypothetical protein
VVKWKGHGDLLPAPARCSVTGGAVRPCSPDVRHGAMEVEAVRWRHRCGAESRVDEA